MNALLMISLFATGDDPLLPYAPPGQTYPYEPPPADYSRPVPPAAELPAPQAPPLYLEPDPLPAAPGAVAPEPAPRAAPRLYAPPAPQPLPGPPSRLRVQVNPAVPVPVPVPVTAFARGVPTVAEFAAGFEPTPGEHVATVLHPRTGRPVTFRFCLPPGVPYTKVTPRKIVYEYGRYEVEIVFRLFGRVTVDYDD